MSALWSEREQELEGLRARDAFREAKEEVWAAYAEAVTWAMAGGPRVAVLVEVGERWWAVGPTAVALSELPPWLAARAGGGVLAVPRSVLGDVARWVVERGLLLLLARRGSLAQSVRQAAAERAQAEHRMRKEGYE